jgi:hypothetical protein
MEILLLHETLSIFSKQDHVPKQPASGWTNNFVIAKSHHEFVWHRESVSEMRGSSLQKTVSGSDSS